MARSSPTFNYDEAGNREKVIDTGTAHNVTNTLNQYNQAGSYFLDYDLYGRAKITSHL